MKNEKDNISKKELQVLKLTAKSVLNFDEITIQKLLKKGEFEEFLNE